MFKFTPEMMESMLNPLGSLGLTTEQKQMLFFRHLNAEYAGRARYGKTPNANAISRAAQTFSGIGGGGMDPMMMMIMQNMMSQQNTPAKADPKDVTPTTEELINNLAATVSSIVKRLDKLAIPK